MKNKTEIKKIASLYIKVVEWSEEDQCFVGKCPELFFGGVHGDDETDVYRQLCEAVEDAIESKLKHEDKLPDPALKKNFSGKFVVRMPSDLHKALAMRAIKEGVSLNELCVKRLKPAA
ncbi:MAG: toxin-antitoxin system HicB family antitoxin [Verrucomicrobiae bacterium]|nr:toxin-antitoxin system HicB family antitoxin [Verrucomicrobiae bacterium]